MSVSGPGSSYEEITTDITFPVLVRFTVQDDTVPWNDYVSGHITATVESEIGRFQKTWPIPTWTKERIIAEELRRFASWPPA